MDSASAQPKLESEAGQLEVNFDPVACKACHEDGKARFAAFKSDTFVRLDESKIWLENDPHSRAFEVLKPNLADGRSNEILRRMERVYREQNPNYQAINDVNCLVCHSTDKKQGTPGPRTPDDFTRDEGTSLGITCAGCHGGKVDWQGRHFLPGVGAAIPWRIRPPEEKEAAGMANLRDPMVKAELCASCHVGDPEAGKVVTHEMYAAGHPPLPPFELVTFMQDQPRHWGYPHELPFFEQFANEQADLTWKIFRYYPPEVEEYLARHMAAGAIAALKAEMSLIQADAERATKEGGLPDFARFDCYACHHDLRYPSARQQRGYEGVPGRPTLKAWVAALPGVVAGHAALLERPKGIKQVAGRFDALWTEAQQATLARPFGDPKRLFVAAGNMTDWCRNFADTLATAPAYDRETTERLLADIRAAATSERWLGDAEAVMHLTWAYRSLRDSVKMDADQLSPLAVHIPLRVRDLSHFPDNRMSPVIAGEILPQRLRKIRDFDPNVFQTEFKRLTK
jgi:hypothetical protein